MEMETDIDLKELNTSEKVEDILFSTYYKRKISFKDFLLTKKGLFIVLLGVYFYFENILNGWTLGGLLVVSFFFYMRERLFSHEKETHVWFLKFRKIFFEELEEEEKRVEDSRADRNNLLNRFKECSK